MKRHLSIVAMVIMSLLMVSVGSNAKESSKDQVQGQDQYVVIDVNVVDSLADAAYLHFSAAREQFVLGHRAAAAAELREAAGLVRLQAVKSQGEAKADLEDEADRLDALADRVESGAAKDVKELDREIGMAYRSLVRNHYDQAARDWAEEKFDDARAELGRARRDLERGREFAEEKSKAAYDDMIEQADQTLSKMERKSKRAAKEVKEDLENFQFDPSILNDQANQTP